MTEETVSHLYAALPHSGAMRLIDALVSRDAESLVAVAGNHRDPGHPLRLNGRLHGLAALEYAAQACALHGVASAQLGTGGAGTTVVATVQELTLTPGDLDLAGERLEIAVCCSFRQRDSAVYDCRVQDHQGWSLSASLGLIWSPAAGK